MKPSCCQNSLDRDLITNHKININNFKLKKSLFKSYFTAYKTCVFQAVISFLLFLSQITKRIDNHTKNEIHCDYNDDEEEEQIVNYSKIEQRLLIKAFF